MRKERKKKPFQRLMKSKRVKKKIEKGNHMCNTCLISIYFPSFDQMLIEIEAPSEDQTNVCDKLNKNPSTKSTQRLKHF